jgi:hypothetical protein
MVKRVKLGAPELGEGTLATKYGVPDSLEQCDRFPPAREHLLSGVHMSTNGSN